MDQQDIHVEYDQPDDTWQTSDIDIAATLVCMEHDLVDILKSNRRKMYFVFKNSRAIPEIVDGYWSNKISIHPLTFTNTRKNLKSRVLSTLNS